MHNIDRFIEKVLKVVESHKLSPGVYSRWIWQDKDNSRDLGKNEYGCADAANILYSVGRFPSGDERNDFVEALRSLQNKETGLFTEKTHHPIHTTAHCTAALELFDAKPSLPIFDLIKWNSPESMRRFLSTLEWKHDPWNASHQGAGIYASLKLTHSLDSDTEKAYFDWLWEETDPETGFWKRDCVGKGKPVFHSLAGSFHYLFNHQYAAAPLRYPEKMIDSCLSLYKDLKNGKTFGKIFGFSEIDWIYCLNRASRETPHRFYECKEALRDFADYYVPFLNEADEKNDDGFNDLHALFGTVCAVIELRNALPGYISSSHPLKLVLDRRPFI